MILIYLLIALFPFERHHIWGSAVGSVSIIKYVGAACLLYTLIHLVRRTTAPRYLSTIQSRFTLGFGLLAGVSFLRDWDDAGIKQNPFVVLALMFVLAFVVITTVDSAQRLRMVLLVTVGSIGAASLYMIREWQKYHDSFLGYRPSGTMGDPNYFASSAILCIPVGLYLAFERKSVWQKYFCLGSVLVTVLAVLLGSSRGGYLGLCVMSAVMLLQLPKRQRVAFGLLMALVLIPINLLYSQSPLWRMVRPANADDLGRQARLIAWKAGVRMVVENPLFGIGIGQFKPQVERYEDPSGTRVVTIAHNSYLEIAAEMGLPAVVLYVALLSSALVTLEGLRRRSVSRRVPLIGVAVKGVEAGLAGAAVAIFFISGQYQKILWLFLALSMTLPYLALRAQQRLRVLREQRLPVSEPTGGGRIAA